MIIYLFDFQNANRKNRVYKCWVLLGTTILKPFSQNC